MASVPEQTTTTQGRHETTSSQAINNRPPPYAIPNYSTFAAAASNQYKSQSQTSDEYLKPDHYDYIATLQDSDGCTVMYNK